MTDTAQAVADKVDSGAKPDETVGAQDELDTLLAQYQEGHEKPKEEPKAKGEQPDPVYEWVKQEKERSEREASNKALSEAVTAVKTESGVSLPDKMVRGYLELMAQEDPRIGTAFVQRHQNPDQWNKVLKAAGKKLASEMGQVPDSHLTSDRNVIESAVRSASTSKPTSTETVDFSGMDKNQLDKWLRENG